jgi:hypothetical protein
LSQPLAALLLCLLLRLIVLFHLSSAKSRLPVLLHALRLALVVCLCFGLGLRLCLSSLLCLLALDFGIFGGVP